MNPNLHPLSYAKDNKVGPSSNSTKISEASRSDHGTRGESSGHKKRAGSKLDRSRSKKNSAKRTSQSQSQQTTNTTPSSVRSTPSSQIHSEPAASIPSAAFSTPVSNVWVPGGVGSTSAADRSTVVVYCAKGLWHWIKFIRDKEYQLRYSATDNKSICYHTLVGCSISPEVDKLVWWESKGRKWVNQAITNLRNSKMMALKAIFFGKLYWSIKNTTELFLTLLTLQKLWKS